MAAMVELFNVVLALPIHFALPSQCLDTFAMFAQRHLMEEAEHTKNNWKQWWHFNN